MSISASRFKIMTYLLPQLFVSLPTIGPSMMQGLGCFVLFVLGAVCYLLLKRRQTRQMLERSGLPTVFWIPRFVNYLPEKEDASSSSSSSAAAAAPPVRGEKEKLASTTITRILPRMERLGGPYGMYGTVYGVSTAVVHVAHPVPARSILLATGRNRHLRSQDKKKAPASRARSSLLTSSGVTKAPAYNHFKDFCGEGVFTADGDEWREKRVSLLHCLLRTDNHNSSAKTSGFENLIERQVHRAANSIIEDLQRLGAIGHYDADNNDNGGTATLNVVPLLQRATIGIIYRYITHDDLDFSLSGVDSRRKTQILDQQKTITGGSSSLASRVFAFCGLQRPKQQRSITSDLRSLFVSYLEAVINIRMIILAKSRSIWFLLPRWCYQCFSLMCREEERTMIPIRRFAHMACQDAKPGSPLASLRTFSSHNKRFDTATGQSKDLLDEAITLLFAGQDTSAATLSWTLHLLSLYPDKQTKLAEEVRRVLSQARQSIDDGVSTQYPFTNPATGEPLLTKGLVSKMPYLDAVIKESMRLYPVAPFIVRKLTDPISLPRERNNNESKARVLPAGCVACVWIYGLHRNPKLWDRPDDFLPERWIDPNLRDEGSECGAFMPFAIGPRNCLGQPLAHIILRCLLTRLIDEFEFRDDEFERNGCKDPNSLRKDMQAGFTVLPRGGVELSVCRRRATN